MAQYTKFRPLSSSSVCEVCGLHTYTMFRPLGLHQMCAKCVACIYTSFYRSKNVDKHLAAGDRHPVYWTGCKLLVADIQAISTVHVGDGSVGGLDG